MFVQSNGEFSANWIEIYSYEEEDRASNGQSGSPRCGPYCELKIKIILN